MSNPICVAIDTPDLARAVDLARSLKGHVGHVKLGLEFFYAHGFRGYEAIAVQGTPIFLDLKLHDIPNTVEQGLRSLMTLKPAIINVHAAGGFDMLRAARNAVGPTTKLIAVTVLTSLSDEDVYRTGHDMGTAGLTERLARLAHEAGLHGIVCSPLDLARIRKILPRDFLTVVPGIRPADANTHDQKRVATPAEAMAAGADIMVIGRAITGAADPVAACQSILRSLAP
jgi:orotidine-5'-phosphate decarboxylase